MSNDDHRLDDDRLAYDLSAWEAPPPPADLADVVIGRLGGSGDETTDVAIAMPAVEQQGREPRRTWLVAAAAVAAVVLAIGAWSLVRSTRPAAPTAGSVVADRARTLALDTVHGSLDAGADVRWQRTGSVLHVEQRAGTAVWRVDRGEMLVIAAGAASASVEATGANLRVEVQMNAMDARVIGASTLTAAAVAMVTVVVYEGHVKVSHGQQTVVVAPGTTYRVNADEEAPSLVGAAVPCDAGALKDKGMENINLDQHAAALEQFEASLACKRDPSVVQLAFMEACSSSNAAKAKLYYKQLTEEQQTKLARICIDQKVDYLDDDDADTRCDEVSCVLTDYDGECCKKYKQAASPAVDALTRADISAAMAKVKPAISACGDRAADAGKLVARVQVRPNGSVANVTITTTPNNDVLASCAKPVLEKLTLRATKVGGTFSYPFVFSSPCDAAVLQAKGMEHLDRGMHAAALASFEDALRCEPSAKLHELAFMSSCNAANAAKARQYYGKLSGAAQQKLAQICLRNGIDPVTGTQVTACDAEELKEEGMRYINDGRHDAALNAFEKSLKCKRDPYVVQLAFMEACSSANEAKAKIYYRQLTRDQQDKFRQICQRQHVAYDDAPRGKVGSLELSTTPAAKVIVDGKDTGLTTPVRRGQLTLAPGKHKITFVIGGDKFTYAVDIKAGETTQLVKDLR